MEYWHSTLTEKSWNILKKLKEENFSFILIGGWAAYLWGKTTKSKDIDIIVDFNNLEKIKQKHELKKNDALKKYEIVIDEIDIDIYVPYYSKLAVPLEDIQNYKTEIENFDVVNLEILLILKQGAELERGNTEKGEKDRLDILSLLINCDINFDEYHRILKKYKIEHFLERLMEIIKNFKEIKYINMNPREFKLKKERLLGRLKKV